MAHRIKELFAFVAIGAGGDEGLLVRTLAPGVQPMIADSSERLEMLRPEAQAIAELLGSRLAVAHFVREEQP